MGSFLAEAMRLQQKVPIGLINYGDVRADLAGGAVTYGKLFDVLPKNLKVIVLRALPVDRLARNFKRAIRSCGSRGILETAGVHPVFTRTCAPGETEDPGAKLLRLVADDHTVLWEDFSGAPQIASGKACPDQEPPCPGCVKVPTVDVATTDFVALDGGAGYCHFVGSASISSSRTLADLKDSVHDYLVTHDPLDPAPFAVQRYVNCGDAANAGNAECRP
jgi:hypothetical protein